MRLLLVRHGHAEERENWNDLGKSDILRPLTKKGIARFAESLEGLKLFVPVIDHIFSSQLTRAVQTAEIMANFYESGKVETIEQLNPGKSQFLVQEKFFNQFKSDDVIVIVGHQPDLSILTAQLLFQKYDHQIELKKGGVIALEKIGQKFFLNWVLTQKHLCQFLLE
jgi:phosphohistidine phosphatase